MSSSDDPNLLFRDNLINVLKNQDKNKELQNILSLFNSIKYNINEDNSTDEKYIKMKNVIDNLNSWFNNDGKLIGTDTSFNLYIKNKNISLNMNLKERNNDTIFNRIVNKYPLKGSPYNKTSKYDNYIFSSNFINQTIIQCIINDTLKKENNSLMLDDLFIMMNSSNGLMDGYTICEGIPINTTLANLDLDEIKIVYKNKEINNYDVKCFFILNQLVKIFIELDKLDFNHGKLTAYNVIVDVNDKKYIND